MTRNLTALTLALLGIPSLAGAQGTGLPPGSPTIYAAAEQATPDAFSTAVATALLDLPGIASDFVMLAGGTLLERPDGTARLSALVGRRSETDRMFELELELSGRVDPSDPSWPPLGTLPFELEPGAYAPIGPVDPATFHYYTSGAGVLHGRRAYEGARIDLALVAPCQVGAGANNRNVGPGLAGSWSMTVVSHPQFMSLLPAGDAAVRADLSTANPQCLSHADRDAAQLQVAERFALALPGVGNDYVFIPTGEWTERADGTFLLSGELCRELDFADRWQLTLVGSDRRDPGDAAFPPAAGPVLGLAAPSYSDAGGPIEPQRFRYYETVTGRLDGEADNSGAVIDLVATRPMQVGLGANNANLNFGTFGEFAATILSQAAGRPITVTGAATLRANIADSCILPYPNQTPGLHLVLDNVTGDHGMITGQNLAWIEQLSFDNYTITTGNPRNWHYGYLKVLDTTRVEVHPPQGYTPGTYTTRVFTRSGAGGFRTLTLQRPAAPVIRTPPDRTAGETMDWMISAGPIQGAAFTFLALSFSNTPSVVPGAIDLGIGAQFSDLVTLGAYLTDPATGVARIHAARVPAIVTPYRWFCQGVVIDPAASNGRPIPVTDVWFTDFR